MAEPGEQPRPRAGEEGVGDEDGENGRRQRHQRQVEVEGGGVAPSRDDDPHRERDGHDAGDGHRPPNDVVRAEPVDERTGDVVARCVVRFVDPAAHRF